MGTRRFWTSNEIIYYIEIVIYYITTRHYVLIVKQKCISTGWRLKLFGFAKVTRTSIRLCCLVLF